MMKQSTSGALRALSARFDSPRASAFALGASALAITTLCAGAPAAAQGYPVSDGQRATAQQTAQAGVPLSELAPDAPQEYTVKRGDTLWHISGVYLRKPWRWPELWGMNKQVIHNPHLIYPGQQLYLDRVGDRAVLRSRHVMDGQNGDTVRVSPRNRTDALDANPLPTLEPGLIEPFLTESLIVDDSVFKQSPRIVAVESADRLIASMGDRAYALGTPDAPVMLAEGQPTQFQVFREATPLQDPVSGDSLGYEAQFVGRVTLTRSQGNTAEEDGTRRGVPIPATFRIDSAKQEMSPGDRLLPTPERDWRSYVPHAPEGTVDARVVKVFGDKSVRYAGKNQIVVINKGQDDGIETGNVLMVLTAGRNIKDKTGNNATLRLPDERNGLAMVFRPFKKASYALIMDITEPVQAGDKLVNPQ